MAAIIAVIVLVVLFYLLLSDRFSARLVRQSVSKTEVTKKLPETVKASPSEAPVHEGRLEGWIYDMIFNSVGVGVVVTGLKGNIKYFNAQAEALTSFSKQTAKGKHVIQIFPAVSHTFNGIIKGKRLAVDELSVADPKGKNKRLKLTLAPLSDPLNGPIGFVFIIEDITRQREIEEMLRVEEKLRDAREREFVEGGKTLFGEEFQFEGVIGQSSAMKEVYRLIQTAAGTNANVLITGESGTGKETIARAICFNGPRRDKSFVEVSCGAILQSLIEDELFGHVRGAFTGAVSDRAGLLKLADGGTIFLDEVEELTLHLQAKLLRVLEEKAFIPVGGNKRVMIDVRVISASNKDLKKEIKEGRFRGDLFYRLNVVQIALPPLRNRKDDIPLLVRHFIKKFAQAHNKQVKEISPEALRYLRLYSYSRNIRELENIIEHAVAVTKRNVLTEEDLPAHIHEDFSPVSVIPTSEEIKVFEKKIPGGEVAFFNKGISLDDELATHEKSLLVAAFKKAGGVQKKAAELLGISYRSFRHRLEKYGLTEQ
jgi:two-component system response regulator PilR (NtrC family)